MAAAKYLDSEEDKPEYAHSTPEYIFGMVESGEPSRIGSPATEEGQMLAPQEFETFDRDDACNTVDIASVGMKSEDE